MTASLKRPFGRDEVVAALLDAANRLFAAAGPADVSLRAIARAAGVNHRLVHRHFGTRDALVDRLLERIAAQWIAEVQSLEDFGTAIDSMPGEAAVTTAASLALVFGWRFFHPYLRAALHLEGESFEALHDAMRRSLRKLAAP